MGALEAMYPIADGHTITSQTARPENVFSPAASFQHVLNLHPFTAHKITDNSLLNSNAKSFRLCKIANNNQPFNAVSGL